jgi:tripartite-type tricarboxylate transporter receptor subunit TctC
MRAVYPNFPHDPVRDFVPLAGVGAQPFVIAVHPAVPAQDAAGLLAWLRAQGEAANYGAANPGATNHLAGELLKQLSGTSFTIVPYRTAANAVQDLVAGRMQVTIDSPTMLAPLGANASTLLPGLQPLSSALPGYSLTAWQVLFSRPGAPAESDAQIRDAALAALRDPAVVARLAAANVETWPDPSPAAALRHVEAEVARWAPIVARMNLTG